MKTYYVNIGWLEYTGKTYKKRSKTFKKIQAKDMTEATEIALDKIGDVMSPSVDMIWEVWPNITYPEKKCFNS